MTTDYGIYTDTSTCFDRCWKDTLGEKTEFVGVSVQVSTFQS